jgi:hypothetical protein
MNLELKNFSDEILQVIYTFMTLLQNYLAFAMALKLSFLM